MEGTELIIRNVKMNIDLSQGITFTFSWSDVPEEIREKLYLSPWISRSEVTDQKRFLTLSVDEMISFMNEYEIENFLLEDRYIHAELIGRE